MFMSMLMNDSVKASHGMGMEYTHGGGVEGKAVIGRPEPAVSSRY